MSINKISKHFRTAYVGGFVRDSIMGIEPNDRDYVVQASIEEFEAIFPDYKRVGNSFPVYLVDGEEVALTRAEISTGSSYQNFDYVAGVTIEEDLSRRDFTIGSIAQDVVTGELIDSFNAVSDIVARIIRTINSNAFIDDPLRILRGLRFATRFNFDIEENTFKLMKESIHLLKTIPMERIALELEKVYKSSEVPGRFFELLLELDALKIHFPYFNVASKIPAGPSQYHQDKSVLTHLLDAFNRAKSKGHSYDVALSSLHHDLGKILTDRKLLPKHHQHENKGIKLVEHIEKTHRFTAKQIELMKVSGKNHMKFHVLEKTKSPVKLVRFFKSIKKYADEVIQVADNDHSLNEAQIKILNDLKRTFKETVIDIPKIIQDRGKEVIVEFVNNQYAQKYKEVSNERNS